MILISLTFYNIYVIKVADFIQIILFYILLILINLIFINIFIYNCSSNKEKMEYYRLGIIIYIIIILFVNKITHHRKLETNNMISREASRKSGVDHQKYNRITGSILMEEETRIPDVENPGESVDDRSIFFRFYDNFK